MSALGNVHTLYLQATAVTDVSALGIVHKFDVGRCPFVSDVSALDIVDTLCLSQCVGVSDVSALGNVHALSLSHYVLVTDVSSPPLSSISVHLGICTTETLQAVII